MKTIVSKYTRSRFAGTGRGLVNAALQRHPIIAVAATVVGSLLRLLGKSRVSGGARAGSPKGETVQAKLDSYSTTRRVRSSYVRSGARARATLSRRRATNNNGGTRHG